MAKDEGTKPCNDLTTIGINRISSLPDDIKAHILSFLSTKKAVQTCILSKKWHDAWAYFPVLKVSQYEFRDKDQTQCLDKFIRFVNGVWKNRKTSRLDIFECYCSGADRIGHFVEWLGHVAALMPRVIVFDVNITKHLDLSQSVFSSAYLENLKLRFNALGTIIKPESINLPSLKVLELVYVDLNDDLAQKLFWGCPALESLVLRWCDLGMSGITSDVLKTLNIDHCWLTRKMHISCPRLVSLFIRTVDINTDISLKNMTSLANADIMLHNYYYDRSILRSLSNATSVKLRGCHHSMKQLEKDIPNCRTFNNLKVLEIGKWDMTCNFDLIACFLKNSPYLQNLYLQLGIRGDDQDQGQPRQEAKRVLSKLEYVELVKISGGNKVNSNKLVKILRRHIKNIGHILIL
ncbi:hypothetical protein LUZ63_012912 [Rhynchospora breviuscula]|uniref:F-box domain-containing protein n=1 Tax=Rhynchospora breviuscula TaxID=2022672 RepID=A0A9Q0C7I9_9POAL|nr:hypothetical protein LUZ63_012912 [Rhynchospora breviuscula]